MGFDSKLPEYERFKQGDQWPAPTERTKNLPRPVFNIVKFFIRSKRSNVLNQTVKMVYSPSEVEPEGTLGHAAQGAKDYTDYASCLWAALDQDGLNEDFIDDAATTGTGVFHYFWDNDVTGGMSLRYQGDLRGEVIDPLNIFFGNPQERRVQRQPWIIISSRESVQSIRQLAGKYHVPAEQRELIQPDDDTRDEGYDAAQKELRDAKKTTLLTKYYRKDGEVYFSKSTKTVDIVKDQPLTPLTAGAKGGAGADAQQPSEPDLPEQKTAGRARITLYPIVVMNWEKRKKCIYGTGEVESVIPNQKAINFNIAMMLLSVQQTGWPKIIAKENALLEDVTNEPGEVITDYWTGGGDGIKFMQPPGFSGVAINLSDKVFELSRVTEGVNEVSSGEPFTTNMAASAIIALQNQAKQPIENIQNRFYRAVKEVGKIWEQFFKTYYTLPRNMTFPDADGNDQSRIFNGAEYADVEFNLKVDVGAGSSYSEALAQAVLDKLYDGQAITLDQYIELSPQSVMPFKEQLKKMREQQAQEQILGGGMDAMPNMQIGNADYGQLYAGGGGQFPGNADAGVYGAGAAMPQPAMPGI